MAAPGETTWMRGIVKAVPSGDSVVIMASVKTFPPPEKTITLSSLIAPKLARRDGRDEPFAWSSREFLRNKCIGKEVIFKVDYKVESIQREFGTVFLGDQNLALAIAAEGWAKVRTPPSQGPSSPYINQLLTAEEEAKTRELGIWSKDAAALASAVRDLPPSSVGQDSGLNVTELLGENKGKSMPAVVEMVRDGSTVRVFLLPSFHFVQVYIAGIQSPSAGRRPPPAAAAAPAPEASGEKLSDGSNGNGAAPEAVPSIAQRLAAAPDASSSAEPYGLEAKQFTESRCLHREVRIVLEGVDGRGSNLLGSLFYPDGDSPTNLAPLLVKEGLAQVVEWSAKSLEPGYRQQLKALELEAKKAQLRVWTGFVPPPSASTAVRDDNFSGRVVEVVSGDCVVVLTAQGTERRVHLSSVRGKKMGNPRTDTKPEPFAREAKEFLRQRLIGQEVEVNMEYSRKVTAGEGKEPSPMEGRLMEFGSIIQKGVQDVKAAAGASAGVNVAELVVARGFATVVRHRDFEERSSHYENLLAAEARAVKGRKGVHAGREPPVAHINDLSLPGSAQKARSFLPFLQKGARLPAVVDYVLSGHRLKLVVPRETCAVAFSLAGVRCPGRGEPFSDEALAFARHRAQQHDVEILVEAVDKTGTFLGSLWINRLNLGVLLLEAGLAKLHPSFSAERTADGAALLQAEKKARDARLKVWANFVEGEAEEEGEAKAGGSRGSAPGSSSGPAWAGAFPGRKRREEVFEVEVVHVLGGGLLYAVPVKSALAQLEAQLKELSLKESSQEEAPPEFSPAKEERVIAVFSGDNSWARAVVVNTPAAPESGSPAPADPLYEVFYIDYGNQEWVPRSKLRPTPAALAASPGVALLTQLALIQVPALEEDFGEEAAQFLGETCVGRRFLLRVEEKDPVGTRGLGQGTGPVLSVTLVEPPAPAPSDAAPAAAPALSVNALLLQEGLARLVRRDRRAPADKRAALDNLAKHQDVARTARLNMWQYGDIDGEDEDEGRFAKPGARR